MAIGKNSVKNTLKISVEGANPLVFVSSIKQSNDKNVSDDDPTVLIGQNNDTIEFGNLMLNDIATYNN